MYNGDSNRAEKYRKRTSDCVFCPRRVYETDATGCRARL